MYAINNYDISYSCHLNYRSIFVFIYQDKLIKFTTADFINKMHMKFHKKRPITTYWYTYHRNNLP